jgi:hypothetical protein
MWCKWQHAAFYQTGDAGSNPVVRTIALNSHN